MMVILRFLLLLHIEISIFHTFVKMKSKKILPTLIFIVIVPFVVFALKVITRWPTDIQEKPKSFRNTIALSIVSFLLNQLLDTSTLCEVSPIRTKWVFFFIKMSKTLKKDFELIFSAIMELQNPSTHSSVLNTDPLLFGRIFTYSFLCQKKVWHNANLPLQRLGRMIVALNLPKGLKSPETLQVMSVRMLIAVRIFHHSWLTKAYVQNILFQKVMDYKIIPSLLNIYSNNTTQEISVILRNTFIKTSPLLNLCQFPNMLVIDTSCGVMDIVGLLMMRLLTYRKTLMDLLKTPTYSPDFSVPPLLNL